MNKKNFYYDVAEYGCIACRVDDQNFLKPKKPASVHHIQDGRVDWAVIPLCDPGHHKNDGYLSIHENKTNFRSRYGHEWELFFLLRTVMNELGKWPKDIDIYIKNRLMSKHCSFQFRDAYEKYMEGRK